MLRKGDKVRTTQEGASRFGPTTGVVVEHQVAGTNTVRVLVDGQAPALYHEVCWERLRPPARIRTGDL